MLSFRQGKGRYFSLDYTPGTVRFRGFRRRSVQLLG